MAISATPAPAALVDQERLESELKRALQATIFHSNLRIAPRRVHQIALEIAQMFRQFLEERANAETTYAYGQHLAGEGVGHRTILALIEVLHRVSWGQADIVGADLPASVQCSSQLLAGYMLGREAYLLQEQDRTRQALERARAQATVYSAEQSD
jgi:hypothetical protein